MNKLDEIKHLCSCEENELIVFENDKVLFSSFDVKYNNNTLTLDSNNNVKVFYLLSQDSEINYHILSNVEVTEVLYEITSEACLKQEYTIEENLNVTIINAIENNQLLTRNTYTKVKKDSYLKIDNLYISSNKMSVNCLYDVVESNATVNIQNAIINDSGVKQDYSLNVKHNVKDSSSTMFTYAVSKNNSILNVDTDGIILKGASNTNLNQKTKGIILDDESQIAANPILEIDEYDVIASHGASIGAIDDEELYYLMSRGLSKQTSEKLIINGLIYPFLNSIKDELIKEYISNMIDRHL